MTEPDRLLVESQPLQPTASALRPERSGRREVEPALPDSIERIDWMGRSAWVVSGALAAAVVVALVVWKPEPNPGAQAASPQPASGQVQGPGGELVTPTIVRLAEARLFAYGGPVLREGMALPTGTALREGDELTFGGAACLRLEPGVVVCAEAGSQLSLNSLALTHRVVEVHSGGGIADLSKLPPGASFVMRAGGLRLRGREGRLALRRGGDVSRAWVVRGGAEVRRGTDVLDLLGEQAAAWSESDGLVRVETDSDAREWIDQVARAAEVPQPAPAKPPARRQRSAPVGVATGVSASPTAEPSAAKALAGGSAESGASSAQGAATAESPSVQGASSPLAAPAVGHTGLSDGVSEAADGVADESTPGAASDPETSASAPTANTAADDTAPVETSQAEVATANSAPDPVEQRVRRADEAIQRGDYRQAEREYAGLRADHPRDPRAHSARVWLGDLRLRHMNEPLGALGFYRGYLNTGSGSLDAQARQGVIAALERLRRFPHERKAIRDFLSRYPESPRRAALEQRLELLGGD